MKHALNSIDMTTEKVVLKSGLASLTMSPTGIELELGTNKFEISTTKIVMKSAETEMELSPLGMKMKAPSYEATFSMFKKKDLIANYSVEAVMNDSAGLRMLDI